MEYAQFISAWVTEHSLISSLFLDVTQVSRQRFENINLSWTLDCIQATQIEHIHTRKSFSSSELFLVMAVRKAI